MTTPLPDVILSSLKPYYTCDGKLNIWDVQEYHVYLTFRKSNLDSINDVIRSRDKFEEEIRYTHEWQKFREELVEVTKELNRANNFFKHPNEWCPTNPLSVYNYDMKIEKSLEISPENA